MIVIKISQNKIQRHYVVESWWSLPLCCIQTKTLMNMALVSFILKCGSVVPKQAIQKSLPEWRQVARPLPCDNGRHLQEGLESQGQPVFPRVTGRQNAGFEGDTLIVLSWMCLHGLPADEGKNNMPQTKQLLVCAKPYIYIYIYRIAFFCLEIILFGMKKEGSVSEGLCGKQTVGLLQLQQGVFGLWKHGPY